jgi:hypothetical protein
MQAIIKLLTPNFEANSVPVMLQNKNYNNKNNNFSNNEN